MQRKINFNNLIWYIIYLLCFAAFHYIEFCEFSYLADHKPLPVYLGMALMPVVLSAYRLKDFCNIPTGIYTLFSVAVCGYFCIESRFEAFYEERGLFIYAALTIWWLGVSLIQLVNAFFVKRTRKITRVPVAGIAFILFGICVICSPAEQDSWFKWILPIFLSFYLTEYSEERRNCLVLGFLDGNIIAFLFSFLYSASRWPYIKSVGIRYGGSYSNCNIAAIYYLVAFSFIIARLVIAFREKGKICLKIVLMLIAGMNISLMFMTMTRGAWIAAIIIYIVGAFSIRNSDKSLPLFKVLAFSAAVFAAFIVMLYPTFQIASRLPRERLKEDAALEGWEYVEWEDFVGRFNQRKAESRGEASVPVRSPFAMVAYASGTGEEGGETQTLWEKLDYISGKRLTIYRAYLERLDWVGHSSEDRIQLKKDIKVPYALYHAHNIFLEVGYAYGIPALILFVFILIVQIVTFRFRWHRRKDKIFTYLPIMLLQTFLFYGLFDRSWEFYQLSLMVFLISQHPTMFIVKPQKLIIRNEQ